MKIVKSNAGLKQVFNTDDLLSVEQYYGNIGVLMALHHTHDKTDYDFLKQFFPEDHSIFFDFGTSFFYVL
jgi:hypothetical protein